MQQDVQEFSCVLLDAIEKKAEGQQDGGSNFVKDLFEGEMQNYIRCLNIDYNRTRDEKFYDQQLPVKGFKNLYESLKDYTQEEDLTGDNKYDTEIHGKQDAKKGIKFKKLPKALFFHLRRFEYDIEIEENAKILSEFSFDKQIDLSEFTVSGDKEEYEQFAVLIHQGETSSSGHYVVYVRPTLSNFFV